MHRIKKAISDLRDYLGRDTAGLQKLAEVETIANDVRKQAASEKERAGRAIEQRDSVSIALGKANDRIRKLEADLEREQRIRSQRERDVETWKQEADKLQEQIDVLLGPDEPLPSKVETAGLFDLRSLRSSIKMLRRRSRLCPKPVRHVQPKSAIDPEDLYLIYELSDIMKNLSAEEFTSLGRFVAVFATMGFPCFVTESKYRYKSMGDDTDDLFNKFMPWFRSNIDWDPNATMGGQRVKVGEDLPVAGMRMPLPGGIPNFFRY